MSFLRRQAGDLKLLLEYLVTGGIARAYPRDISTRQYWDGHIAMMEDHYLNKTGDELGKERTKYGFIAERIRSVAGKEAPRILEIGTGFGYSLKKLAAQVPHAEWFGCDFSDGLIAKATGYCADLGNRARFFVWDVRLDPPAMLDRLRFDIVFSHGALTCLPAQDVAAVLLRLSRLTGKMLFAEHDFSGMNFIETLRFRKERGYSINDYAAIFESLSASVRLDETHALGKLGGADSSFLLYELTSLRGD